MTNLEKITAVVKTLNNHYGYGDVRECGFFGDGRIRFVVQGFGMKPVTRWGRIRNNTIYALKHQRKIV